MALSASANASVIFADNFDAGTDQSQTLPGWTLTPAGQNDILVLNSNDYRVNAGGVGDTGTNLFIAFGAGDSPDDGIATTVAPLGLLAGHTYTVSFEYGSFSLGPANTQSLKVAVGGNTIGQITTLSSTNDLSHLLSPYSISFVAAGPGQLQFIDASSNTISVDGLLDNVSVSEAVPEPSTWAMMIVGLLGLGYAGFSRSRGRATAAA